MTALTKDTPPRIKVALLVTSCMLAASVLLAMATATIAAEGPLKIELRKITGQSSDSIKTIEYDAYAGPKITPGTKYTLSRGTGRKSTKWTVDDGIPLIELLRANLSPEEFSQVKFATIRWPGGSSGADSETGGPALYQLDPANPDSKSVIGKVVQDASKSLVGPIAFRSRGHYQLETAAADTDNRFVIEVGLGDAQAIPVQLKTDVDHKSKEVTFTATGVPRSITGERYDFYFHEEVPGVDNTESNLVGTTKHTYGSRVNYQPWVRVTAPDGSRGVATAPVKFKPVEKSQDPPQRTRRDGDGNGSGDSNPDPTPNTGTTPDPGAQIQTGPTQPFQQPPSGAVPATPAPPITPPTLDQPLVQNPDQSRIADLAAASGSPVGAYQTVSGIVLAGPSGQPVEGSSSALPPAVSEVAETIFKTAKDPRALWPFLLALLFAAWISGAARELKRP